MLRTVFIPQCSAVDFVYHLFDVHVGCILLLFIIIIYSVSK